LDLIAWIWLVSLDWTIATLTKVKTAQVSDEVNKWKYLWQ